jgi:PadR family transcriptional regulator PadR
MARPRHSSARVTQVLSAFLATPDEWRYGFDLMRESGIASGTLYPLLARLHADGFLDARWELPDDGSRPRHSYRLTADGAALAVERVTRAAEAMPATPRRRASRARLA